MAVQCSMCVCVQVQWVTGLASDNHLYVTVISPEGALMASTDDTIGEINFQTEVTGKVQTSALSFVLCS